MLDLLIRGATVVDGTGHERYMADVGIRDGRIVSVGGTDDTATKIIDAAGLVVAPGFVDVHTHYDAQVFWDPYLSPSPLHGVTTAIGGNCGFTIAPIRDEHADYLLRMLAMVEGMPIESLHRGVPWGTWQTFGDWLGKLDGRLAVNTGFMAGHSTIRRIVMGEDCHDPNPTEGHLQAMETHLRDALGAGALGFSTSNGRSHLDGDMNPVPSRCAPDDEFIRLASVVREFPGTSLEYIPYNGATSDDERLIGMSHAAQRPINWNVLVVTADRAATVEDDLAVSVRAATRRARVVALENPAPLVSRPSFRTAFGLNAIPQWGPVFLLPEAERLQALTDPEVRRRMRQGAVGGDERYVERVDFATYTIEETFAPANAGLAGRLVGDVARERGVDPLDVLLDVVVADGLRTTLAIREVGGDPVSTKRRVEAWRDRRVVLGASDAGAHLDTLALFIYTTHLLGHSVRDRHLLGLEEAVRLLTDVPARLYGLRDRGRVATGWYADLVIFDPDRIAPDSVVTRSDLPGGASRLYAEAVGIEHVIVNGHEIVRSGDYTGDLPGQVIRSGVDTADVHI